MRKRSWRVSAGLNPGQVKLNQQPLIYVACKEVTNWLKPAIDNYRAAIRLRRMNVLSPEMVVIENADSVSELEGTLTRRAEVQIHIGLLDNSRSELERPRGLGVRYEGI